MLTAIFECDSREWLTFWVTAIKIFQELNHPKLFILLPKSIFFIRIMEQNVICIMKNF